MARRYSTNQRKIVLEFVAAKGGGHFTAEEVYRALAAGGYAVGRATVYRCFEKFTAEGLLRKYAPLEGGGATYEYSGDCAGHYHLKCGACGELWHFKCGRVTELYRHIGSNHNFQIDPTRTVFHGTCGKCLNKEKEPEL